MSEITKKSKQSDKPKPAPEEPAKPKSRIQVGANPFTLHIDDTPENVARAIFGKPLKRE